MSNENDYDLLVIGAGSGGVRAARVAAGLRRQGRDRRGASHRRHVRHSRLRAEEAAGLRRALRGGPRRRTSLRLAASPARHSTGRRCATTCWRKLRDSAASTRETLENHGVDIFDGHAVVTGAEQRARSTTATFGAKFILIATGARPQLPQVPGIEHAITSNEAFHLERLPARILIAGGGYIANEFAGIFNELGSKVTLVNRSDQILRSYDAQIRDRLLQISMTKGIQFLFNAPLERIERRADGVLDVQLGDDARWNAKR